MAATAAMLAALTAPSHAAAETLEVANTGRDGAGSLARAIRESNSDPDRDRIVFGDRARGAIPLDRGLRITVPVKIDGPGRDELTLRGPDSGALLRLVKLGRTTAIRDLSLSRLGVFVAAKESDGKLQLRRTTLSGHGIDEDGVHIESGYKGYSPELNARRVTIDGFHDGVDTGYGAAYIDESTISGNSPGHGVDVGYYGFARIVNSTITGNTASEPRDAGGLDHPAGGGIYAVYGFAMVVNSTISGNQASGEDSVGGGIYGSTILVTSSTVTGNYAERGGGIAYDFGSIKVEDSIVAGNEAANPALADCAGHVDSEGGNVFGAPAACGPAPSDIGLVDPELGPLADNGGPTLTHAIGAGSPAIGQARGDTPKRDQRGVRRDGEPDAGAYER